MMKRLLFTLCLTVTSVCGASAQEIDTSVARHDFFYAGQSKQRRMFIVKDGQVSWTYQDQLKKGEISDAVLMSDGHILVAHQYGVAEVTQDQQTVWSYLAPEGTEIHTIQPIGRKHVVFVQNGRPAKAVVMEIPACRIESLDCQRMRKGLCMGSSATPGLRRVARCSLPTWASAVSMSIIAMVRK